MNCATENGTSCDRCVIILFLTIFSSVFVPFGEGVGDDVFYGEDDGIAFSFNLSVPIVFYQHNLTELYVSKIHCQVDIVTFLV